MQQSRAAGFLCLAFALNVGAQPASVAGTVIDSVTKQPLPGVHVSLFAMEAARNGESDEGPSVYGAISKADGRFSIGGMPPAIYIVNADRVGYVFVATKSGVSWAGQSIALKPGENRTDLVVTMTPCAVVRGRVTDEYGDPVQGVQVLATSDGPWVANWLMGIPAPTSATDDRGEFRLSGAPGKYFVSAEPSGSRQVSNGPPETRTDGSQPAAYSTTWYPSVDSKDRATAIEAIAGRETAGIEFRLIHHRSVSIGGVVTGLPPGDRNSMVRLWNRNGNTASKLPRNERSSGIGADGSFDFSGLPAGDYVVQAWSFGAPVLRSWAVDVHLDSGEETGLRLALAPGDELDGVVTIPGPPASGKRSVIFEPIDGADNVGQPANAPISPDGSFHIASLFPGKYKVRVDPMPENAYIESDGVVDLTHGAGSSKLKIVINPNGAALIGVVIDGQGKPAKAPFSFAILAAAPDDEDPFLAKVNAQSGTFSLTGVKPGKYLLLAVDLAAVQSPEDLKAMFDKGEPVELHAGDRITKNARLVFNK